MTPDADDCFTVGVFECDSTRSIRLGQAKGAEIRYICGPAVALGNGVFRCRLAARAVALLGAPSLRKPAVGRIEPATRNIDGIPGLMVMGEYEWWEARLRPALAFRMMYPGSCISFLGDAGRYSKAR